MFNSLENAPRKWALPLMWALLSILWLAFGVRWSERGLFHRAWVLAAMGGVTLALSLYNLYRAFKHGAKG